MVRRAGALILVVAVSGLGSVTVSSAAAKSCRRGKIAGKSVCINVGQVCNRRYATQYARYGLACTRHGSKGPYHLTRTGYSF